MNFYPRTPAGCDPSVLRIGSSSGYFYPRTPAGCDFAYLICIEIDRNFYPRTPAGCDEQAVSPQFK